MSWGDFVGHEAIVERFRRMVQAGRLPSSFLFCGPAGVGKRAFAMTLAQGLLCEHPQRDGFEACGHCSACQQVSARSHPDLILVSRPADKAQIPIEAFVGVDGKMQEGLCHDLSLKPFRGGRKIALIDDADFIHQEGANSLLKTLEEPPAGSLLILIGTSPQKQLPTIRSRCQLISFGRLTADQVATILVRRRLVEDESQAAGLARLASGSIDQALMIADPEVREFRESWMRRLAGGDPGAGGFAKSMIEFIDAAGSDSAAKRDRMRLLCDWAIEQFHQRLLRWSGASGEPDREFAFADVSAADQDDLRISRCLARCLSAQVEIGLNLNQALWVECWLSDLRKLGRGEYVDIAYA
jgi:DNA polymerase-3 subunit delta'